MILNKAREDFERRIEQGENISFNFTCNSTCHKKRKLNNNNGVAVNNNQQTEEDYYYPLSPESSQSSSSEYEEEEVKSVTRSSRAQASRKKNTSSQKKSTKNGNGAAQTECCIIGCENGVTNRLRFSLRCHKDEDFKPEFLEQGHNKVCHYHYFSDLYKFKKMNKSKNSNTTNNSSSATTKKRNVTASAKRPVKRTREEFESDGREVTVVSAPILLETPCKAVTPGTKIDASVFFSFVGGLNNGSNITKAM